MVTISSELYDSLTLYFETLRQTGYMSYKDVELLMVMNFIEEFVTGCWAKHLTDIDYKTIEKALNCLYGSTCLIKFPNTQTYTSMIYNGSPLCYQ